MRAPLKFPLHQTVKSACIPEKSDLINMQEKTVNH